MVTTATVNSLNACLVSTTRRRGVYARTVETAPVSSGSGRPRRPAKSLIDQIQASEIEMAHIRKTNLYSQMTDLVSEYDESGTVTTALHIDEKETEMTDASPQEHLERAEHLEEAVHEGTPFLLVVSVTIAILAVVAASVGSLESIETAAALSDQNAANLLQNKTSDQWAFFQAKSIKKNAYEIASKQGGPFSEEFNAQAHRNEEESRVIRAEAENLSRQVAEKLHEAERHEKRHHVLTTAVTLLHAAIAISTVAIITRGRRWPWIAGLALALFGIALTGYAYV